MVSVSDRRRYRRSAGQFRHHVGLSSAAQDIDIVPGFTLSVLHTPPWHPRPSSAFVVAVQQGPMPILLFQNRRAVFRDRNHYHPGLWCGDCCARLYPHFNRGLCVHCSNCGCDQHQILDIKHQDAVKASHGWVAEWFMAPVLKTGVGATPP